MYEAIKLAKENIDQGGGPFAAIVVKNGEIVGKGTNRVTSDNDPTGHAEVRAIRDACKNLNTFQLTDCDLYTSCEPCPMCFGAIYWARPEKVFYGSTKLDAANAGFDDNFIYQELEKEITERSIGFFNINAEDTGEVFEKWINFKQKTEY